MTQIIAYALIETGSGSWEEDFKVLSGLSQIPEKRITLLAVKK